MDTKNTTTTTTSLARTSSGWAVLNSELGWLPLPLTPAATAEDAARYCAALPSYGNRFRIVTINN